jgi:hypothetical protein
VLEISAVTARRYVMGRQGLWPGRRWQGLDGTGVQGLLSTDSSVVRDSRRRKFRRADGAERRQAAEGIPGLPAGFEAQVK